MNTPTLREKFEKKHPIPEGIERHEAGGYIKSYGVASTFQESFDYNRLWQGYQSGAEDNQCVVELPDIDKELDGCFDQGICEGYTMAYNECKAAIEASGARVKP